MRFILNFLIRLAVLVIIGIALFSIFPDTMEQIFEIYGALFGPGIIILLIIVAALPQRRK